MSTNTMSLLYPRPYGATLTSACTPASASEYMRERDQEEQVKRHLRELVEEGLSSGPGQALTPQRTTQLKKKALGKLR